MPKIEELPLRDIHLPEAIGWFPPAIGWWLLIIFVPIISYLVIVLLQRFFQKTAVKEAKKLLKQLQTNNVLTPLEKVIELSGLLRRVAMSSDSETNIAGLTGRVWLDYLDSSLKDTPFKNGIGHCLVDTPYQKELPPDVDLAALFDLAKMWLNAQKY
ncbi:MAG: DUF4381 domain-containing protein [Methylococcaceae bacterium]|nr:DUF4381 domain-containing protein [Methylococcaceae bacterium]